MRTPRRSAPAAAAAAPATAAPPTAAIPSPAHSNTPFVLEAVLQFMYRHGSLSILEETISPAHFKPPHKGRGPFQRENRNTTVFIGSEFIFPLQKCSLIKKEEPLTIKSGAPSFRQKARRYGPSFTDSIRDEWPAHRGESYRKTGFSAR